MVQVRWLPFLARQPRQAPQQAGGTEGTEAYLDQRKLFDRLRAFKPIQSLSAQDLRGLEPEDVRFLVSAQMTGNAQQQQLFTTALGHLQRQQARVDGAKTAVQRERALKDVALFKAKAQEARDEVEHKRRLMLDEAKMGNSMALDQFKTMLNVEEDLLKKQAVQAKSEPELRKIEAQTRKMNAEAAELETALERGDVGGAGELTTNQKLLQQNREEKETKQAMMALLDPKTPVQQKEYLASVINKPENTFYYQYTPPKDETGAWIPFYGEDAVEESFRKVPIPTDPRTGNQLTMKDIMEQTLAIRMAGKQDATPMDTINALLKMHKRLQQTQGQ